MYTHVAASAAIILSLATTGCTQGFGSSLNGTDLEAERAALLSVDRALAAALQSKDLAKLGSFYAPDASIYAPGMEAINGQVAINRTLESADCAVEAAQFQIFTNEMQVGAAGDIAYTKGTYRIDRADGQTRAGKYVTIWRKQQDGAWRIAEDILNENEPAVKTL